MFDEITLVGWWDLFGWWIPSLLVGEIPLVHGILVCWLVGSTLVGGFPVGGQDPRWLVGSPLVGGILIGPLWKISYFYFILILGTLHETGFWEHRTEDIYTS